MNSGKYMDILKKIAVFKNLPDSNISSLSNIVISRKYPKNYFIVRHNDMGDSMYIILKGEVKVSLFSESGREVILDILKEGEIFGEMSLLDEMPRSASVITTTDVEALMIKRKDFESHLLKYPEISLNILKELIKRLRRADEIINSLSVHDVAGRITNFFMKVFNDDGKVMVDNSEISFDFTHKDIAAHIGTTRESVTRALNKMVESKMISLSSRKLKIHNSEELIATLQK